MSEPASPANPTALDPEVTAIDQALSHGVPPLGGARLEAPGAATSIPRSTYIGSGDVAAIVGLSDYGGPMDVWLHKVGLVEDKESPQIKAGRFLEPAIASWYAAETRREVVRAQTVRSAVDSWAAATPDFYAYENPDDDGRILEVKNVGGYRAHLWGEGPDELPLGVVAQVTWQLGITGYRRADVARLVGGWDFRIYPVEWDAELFALLLSAGHEFWQLVQTKMPPALDGSEGTRRYLKARYPNATGELIRPAPAEAILLAERYAAAAEREKQAGIEKDEAQARLCALCGEAEGIEGVMTWRTTASAGVDWKALAEEAGAATKERMKKFTRSGYRRFRFTYSTKED